MEKTKLFFCLYVLSSFVLFSQNRNDTLTQKPFEYLIERFYSETELNRKKTYEKAIILKSKIEKDTARLIVGYYLAAYSNQNEKALKYADSVIMLTEENNSTLYQPAATYILKGAYYYDRRGFQRSLDNFLMAYKYAVKHGNENFIFKCKHSIGLLKNRIGEHNGALEVLKENMVKLKNGYETDEETYLASLFALANCYNELQVLDSASFYNKQGVKRSIQFAKERELNHFILNEGITQFYVHNYKASLDSIRKALPFFVKDGDKPNQAVGYFYRGKSLLNVDSVERAIDDFKRIDTIFNVTKDVLPKIRESYEILINHYKKIEDLEQELYYVNQLLKLDSLLFSNEIHLNKRLTREYDIPKLINKKEKIIDALNKKDIKKRYVIILLVGLLVAALFGITYFYTRQITYKKRFQELMGSISSTPVKDEQARDFSFVEQQRKTLGISQEVIERVLAEIKIFEKNEEFLKKVTIQDLAKTMNTNANYLSKIINHYKNQSFSSYLNELRVRYTLNRLKEDAVFRKYTLSAIAEEVGFHKAESFSRAFYKIAKVKPSFFLKQLVTQMKEEKAPNS